MITLLLIINAHKPKKAVVDFGCRMAALTNSKLTGLFLWDLSYRGNAEYHSSDAYLHTNEANATEAPVTTDTDQAIAWFVRECANRNITTEVLIGKSEPAKEIIRKSRYADLVVLDPSINASGTDERTPTNFAKEIMAGSECPVLLAPEKETAVEEVIFCYDGSASSVYAIKQFTYLLPEFKNKNILLLRVNNGEGIENKEQQQMLHWLQAHYSRVDQKTLTGDASDQLFTHFFLKEKKWLVMGAYGRSALSNLFRPSAADSLIRAIDLPVFITHFND